MFFFCGGNKTNPTGVFSLFSLLAQHGKIVIPKECKRDSKGFRILENQVPDFTNCTNDEIVSLLRNSVLYSDDNLIILNKPYNLVIHESETTKDRCLSSLLEDLAKDLDPKNASPKLLTVHRLDKETTGCLLLARTEIMAQTLKSYFAQRKIMKKYLIITSKVPEPLEGIIDIPISEGFIERKSRMVLQPEIPSDIKYYNHCNKGKRAVTQYKVISTRHNAALVEVRPETGIKHQIRVHFGFGLSCPILGDHKYSHLTKLAPQKLQADILQKLYVRQSKVRYIPMHIHAQSIVIPDYFEKRNLFVAAPLPEHMKRSMKALQLIK
ncbi:pseudouridylate synthase RPUSD4, mitochondrial-like [Uloborus diversus]|uniref:pseudouridylate synthase RPUSD4, mitochondrial-like n=1 Tax=Uloborus diversus TaxID=327109 RepID=UPI00240A5D2C|nr:pseudouridylate synthase RPUSD4, mitochondrial-like [Uloborus diversus]